MVLVSVQNFLKTWQGPCCAGVKAVYPESGWTPRQSGSVRTSQDRTATRRDGTARHARLGQGSVCSAGTMSSSCSFSRRRDVSAGWSETARALCNRLRERPPPPLQRLGAAPGVPRREGKAEGAELPPPRPRLSPRCLHSAKCGAGCGWPAAPGAAEAEAGACRWVSSQTAPRQAARWVPRRVL